MVMMSLAATMMTNTSITSLGQAMKNNTMQTIRKCMDKSFMKRRKNKLQNNIKLRMKTTFQRQTKRKKKRELKSLKHSIKAHN